MLFRAILDFRENLSKSILWKATAESCLVEVFVHGGRAARHRTALRSNLEHLHSSVHQLENLLPPLELHEDYDMKTHLLKNHLKSGTFIGSCKSLGSGFVHSPAEKTTNGIGTRYLRRFPFWSHRYPPNANSVTNGASSGRLYSFPSHYAYRPRHHIEPRPIDANGG